MFRKGEPAFLKILAYFSFFLGIAYNLMGVFGQIKREDIHLSFGEAMGSMAIMSLLFFGLALALLFLERRLRGKKPLPRWIYILVLTWSAALMFFSTGFVGRIATLIVYIVATVVLLLVLSRNKQNAQGEKPKQKAEKTEAKQEVTKKEFPFSVLVDQIKDEELKKDILEIEKITQEIYQNKEMRKIDPQQVKKIETYYLPTLTSLLNTYVNLEASKLGLDREQKLKQDIHSGIASIKQGFYQICENTYQTTSMSISAELSALETVLASDGLLEDDIRRFYTQRDKEKTPS